MRGYLRFSVLAYLCGISSAQECYVNNLPDSANGGVQIQPDTFVIITRPTFTCCGVITEVEITGSCPGGTGRLYLQTLNREGDQYIVYDSFLLEQSCGESSFKFRSFPVNLKFKSGHYLGFYVLSNEKRFFQVSLYNMMRPATDSIRPSIFMVIQPATDRISVPPNISDRISQSNFQNHQQGTHIPIIRLKEKNCSCNSSSGCMQLQAPTIPTTSPSDNVGAVIGGVVGFLLMVLVIVLITIISVLCWRHTNKAQKASKNVFPASGRVYAEIDSQPSPYVTPVPINTTTHSNQYYSVPDTLTSSNRSNEANHYEMANSQDMPDVIPNRQASEHIYAVVPSKSEREKMKENLYSQIEADTYSTVIDEPLASYSSKVSDALYASSSAESDVYWTPSRNEDEIYSQMAQWKFHEIQRYRVRCSEKLGEGQFGDVYRALWQAPSETVVVAVKQVKKGSPESEKVKLLQEAAILGQFKHRHVVGLFGVVTVGQPKIIVMELLTGGSLKEHLDLLRNDSSRLRHKDLPEQFLQFCKQVVDGLVYLAKKAFVHRDIAARNILLDSDLNCKISDFGMTRALDEESYYKTKGGQIPVKWTAPEAVFYKKYSTASDVWSYGMLMYEIWSVGHKPFEFKSAQETVRILDKGHCQPPPPGCPRVVYSIMVQCWNPLHNERPTAVDIFSDFCKSERTLLAWSEEDKQVSAEADVLGAPLIEGSELYMDLQTCYKAEAWGCLRCLESLEQVQLRAF